MQIQSRRGSLALGIVGVVSVVSAVATLLIYVVRSWDAASILDRLLQFSLIVSAAVGLYFVVIGVQNFGVHPHLRLVKRGPRARQASAATSS